MPTEERPVPCADLRVLTERVSQLERAFEMHVRTQNAHLASIDGKLADLSKTIADNRQERTEQVDDVREQVSQSSIRQLTLTITLGAPTLVGLLYIILNHGFK